MRIHVSAMALLFTTALLAAAPASKPAFDSAPRTGPSDAFKPSAANAKYKVEANIPYDKPQACVLDMLYPKDMKKSDAAGKKFPGVIMFHGGGWIRTSKSTMSSFYSRYLDHGFVVCNAEYRLADNTAEHQFS